jgi:4-aminobutyrate aminotransferase / (S)-3-amino-2-methylpropionate transaminase / 5-aminovalerate transaminase
MTILNSSSWKAVFPTGKLGQPDIVISKAQGSTVFDDKGVPYIDFTSANYSASIGYANQFLDQGLEQIIQRGIYNSYDFLNEYSFKLAKLLVKLSPSEGRNKALLLTGGGEAIDAAIRICRCFVFKKKPKLKYGKIVCFMNSFHGRTLAAWNSSDSGCLRCGGCHSEEHILRLNFPENNDRFPEDLPAESISCILIEPYQSRTGRFFPKAYMQQIRKWCNSNSVPLIADEIQSGFGRTGKLFAMQHYGIKPDLTVCGKGISSAAPLSAIICTDKIIDSVPETGFTLTHGGNLLSAVSAYKTVKFIIEQNLVEKALNSGKIMQGYLNLLKDINQSLIQDVYGKGLVFAVHFTNKDKASKVVKQALKQGLLLFSPIGNKGSVIKLCPPLTVSTTELKIGLDIFKKAVLNE